MNRSIVWRCALTVAFAQVLQIVVLVTLAYTTGARPLFNAWIRRETATIQRHQQLLREIAGTQGREAAARVAQTLSVAEIRHLVIDEDELRSQNNYLDMASEEWRSLAEKERVPTWDQGELRSITFTDPPKGDPGSGTRIGILSIADWPIGRMAQSNPDVVAALVAGSLLFSAVAGGLVAAWFTGPIVRLRDSVNRFAAGELAARPPSRLRSRNDEIGGLARELALMEDRISSLVGAQRELLDDVAHELRSPLARMNIAVELAEQATESGPESPDPDEAERLFERIRRECDQLASMVNRLLELSALEHQVEDVARVELSLSRLIGEIAEDCDFEARAADRRVELRADQEVRVLGNEDMLRTAIENVVRNAIRYTPTGRSVDVKLTGGTPQEGRAVVTIRDHGAGVPDDALSKLFQPFYRVESDRSADSGGTGLGLALADRAVRVHAGSITARNHADGGLEVMIDLPAYPAGG